MTAAVLVGHVGGLAAALGAGVAIGLSVAAPASAEPTDSRAGGWFGGNEVAPRTVSYFLKFAR